MQLEQAIFTSRRSRQGDGYQLVAQSSGVTGDDAQALAHWCPSHDTLHEFPSESSSINFFRLPSGAYGISRTTLAGQEYSARGGQRVYTHVLVADTDVLSRFSNNPFALLNAAISKTPMEAEDKLPETLTPLTIVGRASTVDTVLLRRLTSDPGADAIATLLDAVMTGEPLAVVTETRASKLFAGIFAALPVEYRLELSFSTALKDSTTRPFRMIRVPADEAKAYSRRGASRLVVDLANPNSASPSHPWVCDIHAALSKRDITTARRVVEQGAVSTGSPGSAAPTESSANRDRVASSSPATTRPPTSASPRFGEADRPKAPKHGTIADDRAVSAFGEAVRSAMVAELSTDLNAAPSSTLEPMCPSSYELLETLDDAVFEAVAGKDEALEEVRRLWPHILAKMDPALVEESRAQYARHVLDVWQECVDGDQINDPNRAIRALDVLECLFGT